MGRITPDIRWLIRRDLPAIIAIEAVVSNDPWVEDDFLTVLRMRTCIGQVAELDGVVVGFLIYRLHGDAFEIMNLAVDPRFHRRGIGRELMRTMVRKLSLQRRRTIDLMTRESNLRFQLFLRSLGFRATGVARRFFMDTDEDGYAFQYCERNRDVGFESATRANHPHR